MVINKYDKKAECGLYTWVLYKLPKRIKKTIFANVEASFVVEKLTKINLNLELYS